MPIDDPFWRACADHVTGLGLPAASVFATTGFEAQLPGCRTSHSPPAAEPPRALVLHQFANCQGGNTMLPHIAERAVERQGDSVTTVEIECRPLDAIVAERGLTRIDLVKIDVEGFEHEVLRGARATLARYRPKLIVEWHNAFFDGRPEAARALYDLLTLDLGYRLHRIEAGATTRPVTFEDLARGHSDLLCEPPS